MITINKKKYNCNKTLNQNYLTFCKNNNIIIPSLCFLKECSNCGKCGYCLIKVNGEKKLACVTNIKDNDVVITEDADILAHRKNIVNKLLAKHEFKCGLCPRRTSCEFLKLIIANKASVTTPYKPDASLRNDLSSSIVIDNNKCLRCQRCVATCANLTSTNSLSLQIKKNGTVVTPIISHNAKNPTQKCLDQTNCLLCGQCVNNCPTGALTEKSHIEIVEKALTSKYVIAAIAPAVRTALGEEFGLPIGTDVTGKIFAALKLLKFKKSFDISYAADVTIMEESTELLHSLGIPVKNNAYGIKVNKTKKQNGPLFTSCCPSWYRLVNNFFPELNKHVSSTKTPQGIFGSIAKNYFLTTNELIKAKVTKKDLFVVSIMPCVAKKYEATLNKDIDAVLTTRELANLIRKNNIDFNKLTPISGDIPFGEYSGAGVIFGTTGGVMEAAIRTASALITGKNTVCPVKYTPHPKFNGVLTTSVTIGTTKLKAAVVSGAINIFNFLHNEDINKYQFIEFMACAGGCINGGGQPIINKNLAINADYISKRKSVLTNQDNKLKVRMSHLNPAVINLYKKMKVVPCDKNAHKLFHNK